MRANPPQVGLTGGIASGKTTVANMFAALGAAVVDTDVIAREVVAPGSPALAEIRAAFGERVFGSDGGLDRRRMRKIVFEDDEKREQLESILHPRIRERALEQAGSSDRSYVIIVVPLLVGSALRREIDRVLVVDCSEAVQLARLMARDAEDEQQARRMIDAQASRQDRLAIADDVILNEGDLDHTRRQVEKLHGRYLALYAPGAG